MLVVNVALSSYLWAPSVTPARALVPIIETLVLLWLMIAAATWLRSAVQRRIAVVVIGTVLGILLAFALAEAFFRFYFARPFYPRSDIPMVRGGLLLLFGDIGRTADILTPITIALILSVASLLGSLLAWGSMTLVRRVALPVAATTAITLIAIPIMLIAGLPRSLSALTVSWIGHSRMDFVELNVAQGAGGETLPGESESPESAYRLPGLLDRDIYVFAVEAYGYTTVSRPELAEQIDPYRARLEGALAQAGYEVYSSYLESPVAGGYSWLAEATLLTGQWVNSQEKFLDLTGAGLPSLTGMLYANGYYTLTIRPGTIHALWPEGWDLYRFEESITSFEGEFNYVGPWFSYVPVTDQYAIWTGHKRAAELTGPGGPAADRPLLVYYQLVSSHTPFNRIPPFIEDWDDLGDGSIYNERASEIRRFANTWTGGSELDEGFVAGIGYVFDVLTDYVARIMDRSRSPILIIFGDHQPQPPIRTPDAVKSVPIHVASRDARVLEHFAEHGFEPGMVSSQPPPHLRMDQFFPMFAEIATTRPR
jgi:hypothetical protein